MTKQIETKFNDSYTARDISLVTEIRTYMNRSRMSYERLAEITDMPQREISVAVYGQMSASPTRRLEKILRRISENKITHTIFVETSVYKLISTICQMATQQAEEDSIGLIAGHVGVGKTTALRHYKLHNAHVIYIRTLPLMSMTMLLDRLVSETGAIVRGQSNWRKGRNGDKLAAVTETLRGTRRLLIVDEAQKLPPTCMEILRSLSDDAGIGLVFVGREQLVPMLQDEGGRFGEIASRIFFWPEIIQHITRDDSNAIVHAIWSKDVIDEEATDMFYQCCAGSARALGQLITVLRGLCKKESLPAPTAQNVSAAYSKTKSGNAHLRVKK